MARGKHEPKKGNKNKWDKSQLLTVFVILVGFAIAQECIVLMYLCIRNNYTAVAAWLTAAIGLAEVVIGTGLSGYLSLCKSDHKEGGITFESAKAKGFKLNTNTDCDCDNPAI